jgi:hypothetical protein
MIWNQARRPTLIRAVTAATALRIHRSSFARLATQPAHRSSTVRSPTPLRAVVSVAMRNRNHPQRPMLFTRVQVLVDPTRVLS